MILDRISLCDHLIELSRAGEVLRAELRDLTGSCRDLTHCFLDSGSSALCLTSSRNSLVLLLNGLDIGLCSLDLRLLLVNYDLLSFRPLDALVLLHSVGFGDPSFPFGIHVALVLLRLFLLGSIVLELGFNSLLVVLPLLLIKLFCLRGNFISSLLQLLLVLEPLSLDTPVRVVVLSCPFLLLESVLLDRLSPGLLDLNSPQTLFFDPLFSVFLSLDALIFSLLLDSLRLDPPSFFLLRPLSRLLLVPSLPHFLVLSLGLDLDPPSLFLFNSPPFDLFLPLDADGFIPFSGRLLAIDPNLVLIFLTALLVCNVHFLLSDALFLSLLLLVLLPVPPRVALLVLDPDLLLLLAVDFAVSVSPLPVSSVLINPILCVIPTPALRSSLL